MPGTHRNPRSLIVTSAAQLDRLQLQALGDVSGLLNSVVCDQLKPRKPEEVPFLVPQPQDSTVRLYLMPRSISERAWVLCVCLSSDRRRPPREGPSLSPLHAHTAGLMLHGLAGSLGSKLRVSWHHPPDQALPCHVSQPESQNGKDLGYFTPQ